MRACIQTYLHACIYVHTNTYRDIHIYMPAKIHTCILIHFHAHTHAVLKSYELFSNFSQVSDASSNLTEPPKFVGKVIMHTISNNYIDKPSKPLDSASEDHTENKPGQFTGLYLSEVHRRKIICMFNAFYISVH